MTDRTINCWTHRGELMPSKSAIDKAGRMLAGDIELTDDEFLLNDDVLDDYRGAHMLPMSATSQEIQSWLADYGAEYLFAQRLKRKPQILRKLSRLSVRLTQLQDIGGLRIIVDDNSTVDDLLAYLGGRFSVDSELQLLDIRDYREKGRDDSGYRSVHMILGRDGLKLELQVRSKIQHYWAESIERTSVIYGHHLKELQGDRFVIGYFKHLSDVFHTIETGQDVETWQKLKLTTLRDAAEPIIERADTRNVLHGYVNEGIVRTLEEKERSLGGPGLNNWIIVFNWSIGSFISWDVVSLDPAVAMQKYAEAERQFPANQGFEVVLVGATRVATIRETHSHYFGLDPHTSVLETLDESITAFSREMDLDVGAREILACMYRKHFWGRKTVSADTLKNHYCSGVLTFDDSLEALVRKGLVHGESAVAGYALDIKRKANIERYL